MSLESRIADVHIRMDQVSVRLSNALSRLVVQNLTERDLMLLENLLAMIETQVAASEYGCILMENRATAKELGD